MKNSSNSDRYPGRQFFSPTRLQLAIIGAETGNCSGPYLHAQSLQPKQDIIPTGDCRRTAADRRPPRSNVTRILMGDPKLGRSAQDRREGLYRDGNSKNVRRMLLSGMSPSDISVTTGIRPNVVSELARDVANPLRREASHTTSRA